MTVNIETIADRTLQYPFRRWAFGEAIALEGVLEASVRTGRADYLHKVEEMCLATIGRGIGRSMEDHVAPGKVFLLLRAQTGTSDDRLLQAAGELVRLHERMPVTSGGAPLVRADQPGWAYQIWVDSMHVVGPLYAAYALATDDPSWMRRAIDLTLAYARHLQQPGGAFMHGYDIHAGTNGHLWARGQGWALLGMAEVIHALGKSSGMDSGELRDRTQALLDAIVAAQRSSGLWSVVIDHPETYEETTLAAMLVRALVVLRKANFPVPETALEASARALEAVRRKVSPQGELLRVSSATPVGQLSTYATRPFGAYPWGQGPLLLMECAVQE